MQGIEAAINDRNKYPVNREVLSDTLCRQYEGYELSEKAEKNIAALKQDNTYTICTAHQPNLLTGYLYFIYKIAHAIKLSQELNGQHADKHFVPVYFMGSEDNDLDELGTFRYNNERYTWDAEGQKGAVGRMKTKSLKPLLDNLFRVMGPPGEHTDKLKELLTKAYLNHKTMGAATRYIVNELFGMYGLLVLDPDDAAFKQEIKDVIKDDLQHHIANDKVNEQVAALNKLYKSQAYPRKINLFYLGDQLRERIERDGDSWTVLNTDIKWSKDELLKEVDEHPEHFSPNVILRGVLQERILPDVAFIGGGAEVAYWMQLKTVFEHYGTFFPVILLRQSALWIEPKGLELIEKAGLDMAEMFMPTEELNKAHVAEHGSDDWKNDEQKAAIEKVLSELKEQAKALDPTLEASADAVLTKINYQLSVLEKKMLRAEKRKHETELLRIARLKELLFPANSLQERKENFTEYYTLHGQTFIDKVVAHTLPLGNEFMIISVR